MQRIYSIWQKHCNWPDEASRQSKPLPNSSRNRLLETNRKDNSNRELVFYYADYKHAPAKALEVATKEFAWRHDVFTLDCYAWALHVNGQDEEARKHIESALSVGIRDSRLIRHAGEIALAMGTKRPPSDTSAIRRVEHSRIAAGASGSRSPVFSSLIGERDGIFGNYKVNDMKIGVPSEVLCNFVLLDRRSLSAFGAICRS